MAYYGRRLEPTHEEAEAAIGDLVRTLQQHLASRTGLTVNEIVRAGSLGHGTSVPGHFDIDLVIYSSGVSAQVVNDEGYEGYLAQLKRFISGAMGITTTTTRYAVQFTYKDYIEVDLLVSPVWWDWDTSDPSKLFQFLRDQVYSSAEARHRFSVNASKWQVAFMKGKDSKVKEYIIRAKAWRNRLWEGTKKGRPSSYLLSLLVLRAYENRDQRRSDDRSTTDELKRIVRNHRNMDIYWEYYYRTGDYRTLFPTSLPRLVDPANPANNVYESGIGPYPPNKRSHDYEKGNGDWSEFERKVEYFDLTQSVSQI